MNKPYTYRDFNDWLERKGLDTAAMGPERFDLARQFLREQYAEPTDLEVARRWVSEDVEALFQAEISNEKEGGVTPATLSSTIDSVSQGLPFGENTDVVSLLTALLMIRDLLPGDTEVRDLL